MSVAAGAAAAAAAAAAAEMRRREEEEMTSYSASDLAENWEFKIVRSNSPIFRDPEKFRAVLEEEKRGGWVLVEKFDDQRIRLKRRAGAKVAPADFADNYDPYRTLVGPSDAVIVLRVLGVVAGMITAIFLTLGLVALIAKGG